MAVALMTAEPNVEATERTIGQLEMGLAGLWLLHGCCGEHVRPQVRQRIAAFRGDSEGYL
jgi:hypothetical protein